MSVALITHPACLDHDPGPQHPESPARLRRVLAALDTAEFSNLVREAAPLATREQLERVHPAAYCDALEEHAPRPDGHAMLDPDTIMSGGSLEAAQRAAGGAVLAVDRVMAGDAATAFVATRPPGHHAERSRPMGFCLFSNAAIAARHARARWGLGRVAVVDFDVHHGNGTQDDFWDEPELFYASSHQSPCYPGTGAADEVGVARNILNLPLPPRTGSAGFRAAWERSILPALDAWGPELVIVSAGFDAHRADPLAQLELETTDFGWITAALLSVAGKCCGGRLVSLLEGGYDLDALAGSAACHVRALLQN